MNDQGGRDAVQVILEDRARLAARAPQQEMTAQTIDVVVVVLDTERYGLDTTDVVEIQHLGAVAPVPGLPSLWMGLVNIRSQLVPLLDLGACMGLTAFADRAGGRITDSDHALGARPPQGRQARADGGQVVLVEAGAVRAGLLVDEVLGVQRLARTAVGPGVTSTASVRRKLTQGLTASLLTVVDLKAVLTDPRLAVDDQVI